ncbi:NTF2 fold immunity protein [Blastopirellula marina]|uniref:NTF2 fold immunity protein domain-containing protein n=1 Tax=Blastopirellula marina TaxID=124 RepID=A0A2S8GAG1_9BACT|nr:NTF2 fold immunity protein [Blastopirellula marina]PQO41399.1 hypothetical protein C5Y93_30245 [Blastopirellula marina]
MSEADEAEIRAVLVSFFDAMGAWEADCKRLHYQIKNGEVAGDDKFERITAGFMEVFERFCVLTSKPPKRTFPPDNFVSYYPLRPTYGADLEKIEAVEIAGNKAIALTQTTPPLLQRYRYELQRGADGWRIKDNRKVLRTDGKFQAADL